MPVDEPVLRTVPEALPDMDSEVLPDIALTFLPGMGPEVLPDMSPGVLPGTGSVILPDIGPADYLCYFQP